MPAIQHIESKPLAHRVHADGAPRHHAPHHHSHGHDPAEAHVAAKAASLAQPLVRFEVREEPSHLPTAKGELAPNTEGKERVLAVYQGGKQIPIT